MFICVHPALDDDPNCVFFCLDVLKHIETMCTLPSPSQTTGGSHISKQAICTVLVSHIDD